MLILNANPNADALHPDAIYRLGIDNDGDLRNDIAFSFVFSEPVGDEQTVDVYLASGEDARSPEAAGSRIFTSVAVSFGATPVIARSGEFTFRRARSDAFFFDFDGIKNLFDITGGRNFTAPHLGGESPWTGSIPTWRPTSSPSPSKCPPPIRRGPRDIRIWGRCSVRRDGELVHVDRAGHPSVSSFFNTDDTKGGVQRRRTRR